MKKTGLLLINLGTPQQPTHSAVRKYLREFLSDPDVITLPAIVRWLLLNAVILPFHTKISVHAYQQIWNKKGSPLLINSKNLANKIQKNLEDTHAVCLAMRYGTPSVETAVKQLLSSNIHEIVIFPLYPQYAKATTESSIKKTKKIIRQYNRTLPIRVVSHFYSHPHYIDSMSQLIRHSLKEQPIDQLIFSYHGLPQRQVHPQCDPNDSCAEESPYCYRGQCYVTAKLIANAMGLKSDEYQVAFQSRLGKAAWLQPDTDTILKQLIETGKKHVAIVCPSFVADCLETLEEIDIRAKTVWESMGGQTFIRIPCLNAETHWAEAFSHLVANHTLPNEALT